MAAAVAAGAALVAVVDPGVPGHYPACPILAATGWYCPGCGGLRAVHALAHGDVAQALDRNALIVLALPVVLLAYLHWLRTLRAGRNERAEHPERAERAETAFVAGIGTGTSFAGTSRALWISGTVAAGCLVFALLRNLPAFAVLAP